MYVEAKQQHSSCVVFAFLGRRDKALHQHSQHYKASRASLTNLQIVSQFPEAQNAVQIVDAHTCRSNKSVHQKYSVRV